METIIVGNLTFKFNTKKQADAFLKELDNLIEKHETQNGDCFFQYDLEQ